MNTPHTADPVLLSTKLKMPRPRRGYIVRRDLFGELEQAAEMGVVFVRGGAGTGKTTLLSTFILETGLKNTVWLSLDESDDNISSFWYYFTAAVGGFLGQTAAEAFHFLRADFGVHNVRNYLAFLINELSGPDDIYIVLDDVHYLCDPALLGTLDFFIKSMPENLHLLMLSRSDPPVYLGALAIEGRLLFLGGEKLTLSRGESLEFLKNTMRLEADDAELLGIADYAEGWVGGLQLAAAGGSRGGKPSGGFTSDYLTREVFESLGADEQDFLLCTSVPDYFDEGLCSYLFTGLDFDAMLSRLNGKNLFLVCIDEEKGIWRYHNILREYLKGRFSLLGKAWRDEVCSAAVAGLKARGDFDGAVRLLVESGDYDRAMDLLISIGVTTDTEQFLNRIPAEKLQKNLELTVRCVIFNVSVGNFKKFSELCAGVEKTWSHLPIFGILQYAMDFIDRKRPIKYAPSLITLDEIEGMHLSPTLERYVLVTVANILVMDRGYSLAERFTERAGELGTDDRYITYYLLSIKAQLAEETGRLNDALGLYSKLFKLLDSPLTYFMNYDYHIAVAGVYLKRMELERAKESLDRASAFLSGKNLPKTMVQYSYDYNFAEYLMLKGETEKGAELINGLVSSSETCFWLDRLLTGLAAEGLLGDAAADRVIAELREGEDGASAAYRLLCARIMYRRGRRDEADRLTEKVLTFSRANKNYLRLVEAELLTLSALPGGEAARRKRHNLLREAVYYSWENRILQPFFLERRAVGPLLSEFYASSAQDLEEGERSFVKELFALCSAESGDELLSAREKEVLEKLASGLTNPEIAESLCISLSTVKTHVINVYRKLGVSSRLSAAEKAKELGLIR